MLFPICSRHPRTLERVSALHAMPLLFGLPIASMIGALIVLLATLVRFVRGHQRVAAPVVRGFERM